MNPSYSSDWSREEKEEYATKRMNEMKLKNEKFKQRHAEVEKDRLEAEKKCSAVTSAMKILPKTSDSVEEKPTFLHEHRKQREWDIGKSSSDGDWLPPGQQEYHDFKTLHNESDRYSNVHRDYHHSRPPRRGGFYDKRKERQDNGVWRSRGFGDVPFKSSSRYKGSNQSRSTTFQSGNASNHSKENKKNNFKASNEFCFKASSNWNESKQNSYLNNPFPKLTTKPSNDKMWHDDGLNEVQNKQRRVEKWVKSINKVEDWSEGNEKPCKNYKSVGTARNSENYQEKDLSTWDKDGHVDPCTKKHLTQNKTKYEKINEHSFTKNVSTYRGKLSHSSEHNAFVGKKTSPYGHKKIIKQKYNHGSSNYDKIEAFNFKNDPKVKEGNRYRNCGADIWDNVDEDESNDSKVDVSNHGLSDKNKDYKCVAWDYKEAYNFDSEIGTNVRKKEYCRRKESESGIWNDCDQTHEWGDTKSGSGTKQNCGEDGNVIWDYDHGGDWNNKLGSEIEFNVRTNNSSKNTKSESVDWNIAKSDDLKEESEAKEPVCCDMSNNLANVLTDKQVFSSEKNFENENKYYKEGNTYNDTKEMSILTKGIYNLEIDSEPSISKCEANDSNKITNATFETEASENNCNENKDSEFISNCEKVLNLRYELAVSKAGFTEYNCDNKDRESDSAEQNLINSENLGGEHNNSEAEVHASDRNIGCIEFGFTDSISHLIMMEQVPSINEALSFTKVKPLYDLQVENSADSSTTSSQSVSCENNEMNNQNNQFLKKDEKVVLKDESNLSCVTGGFSKLNSNNSVMITPSKLNESNELLQPSICNVEKKNSQVFLENEEKTICSFYEVSANVSGNKNKSSPALSQGNFQNDDESYTVKDVAESAKCINEHETDTGALHLSDNSLPVDTNDSSVKILNIISFK